MGFDNRRRGAGRSGFDKHERGYDSDFGGKGFDPFESRQNEGQGFKSAPRGDQGVPIGSASGTVKFFNPAKGFGFVVRDDGEEDVFVHISAVEQLGLRTLAEGQKLNFTLSDRGGKISATDLVIDGEIVESAPGGGARSPSRAPFERKPSDGTRYEGTVKFFNNMKGFGFIQRDDGQPDAFVHISAVERSGLHGLDEGQRVSFELEEDRRGKMAATNLQEL